VVQLLTLQPAVVVYLLLFQSLLIFCVFFEHDGAVVGVCLMGMQPVH
jgi:hypothetical protein